MLDNNIFWHQRSVSKKERIAKYLQRPCVIWLTGLSGSGKSTIANELEKKLFLDGYKTYLLDGDNIRHGLNNDLGFDGSSRKENIRRVAEVAKLFTDAGIIAICAFISPLEEDRLLARDIIGEEFIEVFINTPLDVCEKRDIKGLYKKARNGEIENFTGITSIYEIPLNPEVVVDTNIYSIDESVLMILNFIEAHFD